MTSYVLHPILQSLTIFLADWSLSRVLVMNDTRYPWLTLVPRRDGVSEMFDLSKPDRALLIEEIARAASGLKKLTGAAKMNVGALGNMVVPLHVHIVARNPGDTAWPRPVWGHGQAVPYTQAARDVFLKQLEKI